MNDVLIKTPEVEAQSPKSNPPSDASNIVNDIIEKHIEKEFIVASKNLKVKKPWKLVKSSRYNGRFFFFNCVTKESKWEIEKEFISEINRDCEGPSSVVPKLSTATSPPVVTPAEVSQESLSPQGQPPSSIVFPYLSSDKKRSNSRAIDTSITTVSTSKSTSSSFSPSSSSSSSSFSSSFSSMLKLWAPRSKSSPDEQQASSDNVSDNWNAQTRSKSGGYFTSKTVEKHVPLFQVIDALGMGGFSIVLKVQDIKTNKTYAMKKISKNKYPTWRSKNQLKFELEALEILSPSLFIVGSEYIYEDYKCIYVFSDVLCGDLFYHLSLRLTSMDNEAEQLLENSKNKKSNHKKTSSKSSDQSVVNKGPFSEKECQIILAELCLAIKHVHKNNIIHRDIKVENVMLDTVGHVKLTDFGLALHILDDVQPVSPGGNITIMPPEMLSTRTGGRHTDWWAYGVLAYELFTGYSPWSDMYDTHIVSDEIYHKEIVLPDYISVEASDFVKSLLNRDYRQRLGSRTPQNFKTYVNKEESFLTSDSTPPSSGVESGENQVQKSSLSFKHCSFFHGCINWKEFKLRTNEPAFKPTPFMINDVDREAIRTEMAKHGTVKDNLKPATIEEEDGEELSSGGGGRNLKKLPKLPSPKPTYPNIASVMIGSY